MIDWLQIHLGMNPELQMRLFATLGTVAGLWVLQKLILAVVYRRVRDPWGRYRWRKTLTYVFMAAGTVVVARMWFAVIQALATVVGLLSAGLAMPLNAPR